jgi:hypothetical protein
MRSLEKHPEGIGDLLGNAEKAEETIREMLH